MTVIITYNQNVANDGSWLIMHLLLSMGQSNYGSVYWVYKMQERGCLGMATDHMDSEMEAGGFCPRGSNGGEYFDTVK